MSVVSRFLVPRVARLVSEKYPQKLAGFDEIGSVAFVIL